MEYRKHFTIIWIALGLALLGCKGESACKAGVSVEVAGNHGHTLDVPKDAIERGVGGTYPLKGGTHEHAVTLTDADMAALEKGERVTTRATSVNAHTHEIGVSCK
jgi:hypothetical protein